MPALYALAQHSALARADEQLLPDEHILAYLDDLYIVTSHGRALEAYHTVATSVHEHAGVHSHLGKLKAWSRLGGSAPPGLADLGDDIWTADKSDELNGHKVLGTPWESLLSSTL